jgi:hypothetical protein
MNVHNLIEVRLKEVTLSAAKNPWGSRPVLWLSP